MAQVNLKALRLDRGLSARAAAEEIGLEQQTLLNAEKGAFTPRPENAKKIADFYGLKVTEIWPVEKPSEAAA